MFFVFCDTDVKDAFWIMDDDGVPVSFPNEADAIAKAKEYGCDSLVVRAVARVTEKTTYKVEKLK